MASDDELKEDLEPGLDELPDPDAPVQTAITVTDLIHKCNAAAGRMGAGNPNRNLLMNCGYALKQLVDRLDMYENPKKVM